MHYGINKDLTFDPTDLDTKVTRHCQVNLSEVLPPAIIPQRLKWIALMVYAPWRSQGFDLWPPPTLTQRSQEAVDQTQPWHCDIPSSCKVWCESVGYFWLHCVYKDLTFDPCRPWLKGHGRLSIELNLDIVTYHHPVKFGMNRLDTFSSIVFIRIWPLTPTDLDSKVTGDCWSNSTLTLWHTIIL